MKYDLATIIRRTRNPRRSQIVIRDIVPPQTLATNLYLSVYKPVVDAWSRAAERVIAEYERTFSALADAALISVPSSEGGNIKLTDSPADLQAALDAAGSDMERLFIILDAALRDWAVQTERWQREKWRGAILSATGVDLGTMLGPEDVRQTLEATIAWNTSLVRDVSAEARRRIGNAVFAGLNQRKPAHEVAKEIREAVAMTRRRSINIASDQLSKLTSALASERRREASIDRWKWRHSGKLHPRKVHLARNGHIYDDSDAPEDLPGRLPFCGCREQAVIDLG